MLAQQCDLEPGEFIWTGGDCHLYLNHLEQADLQLARTPLPRRSCVLRRRPPELFDYEYEDFEFMTTSSIPRSARRWPSERCAPQAPGPRTPPKTGPGHARPRSRPVRVRRSRVHGRGVFAIAPHPQGHPHHRVPRAIASSHREADLRYEDKDISDNHTFLFIVDRGVVIDGGVNGNEARFINHSCDPNCESVIEDRRVFIEAIRTIPPGEELTYDYQIGRDRDDPPNIDEIFACRCGASSCRGSMLWPPRQPGEARGPYSSN